MIDCDGFVGGVMVWVIGWGFGGDEWCGRGTFLAKRERGTYFLLG